MGRQLSARDAGGGGLRRPLTRAAAAGALGAGSGLLSGALFVECADHQLFVLAHLAPDLPFWLVLLACERFVSGRPLGWGVARIGFASLAGWATAFEIALQMPHSTTMVTIGATAGGVGAAVSALGLARALGWPLLLVAAVGAASGTLLTEGFYVTFAAWQAMFAAVVALVPERTT